MQSRLAVKDAPFEIDIPGEVDVADAYLMRIAE
jgi:hypothetical protein